jgi:hypothetical protein
MVSIRRQVIIDADPDAVWDALRDWDALDERLAVGFVTDCTRDGTARIATFASGAVLREEILGCDEQYRRLAWSIVDGPYTHHNGAAEVLDEDDGRTRFVWTSDLRPDALAEATANAMEQGLAAIKRTLEASRDPIGDKEASSSVSTVWVPDECNHPSARVLLFDRSDAETVPRNRRPRSRRRAADHRSRHRSIGPRGVSRAV